MLHNTEEPVYVPFYNTLQRSTVERRTGNVVDTSGTPSPHMFVMQTQDATIRIYQDSPQKHLSVIDSERIRMQNENNQVFSDFNHYSTSHIKLHDLLLKCKKENDLNPALKLLHYIHEDGIVMEDSLAKELISILVEVGCMTHAMSLFDRLESQDEHSWTALIRGYTKYGEPQQLLDLYQKYEGNSSFVLNVPISMAVLKACGELKDFEFGEDVHRRLDKGLVEEDVYVASSLIYMYMKCGYPAKAQDVFDTVKLHNVVTWNALVSGYIENGRLEEALSYYKEMCHKGVPPDGITFICILKACGFMQDGSGSRKIHSELLKTGLLKIDAFVGSSLVDTYAKCGLLEEAEDVFERLPNKNTVSFNAMIARFIEHGHYAKALQIFEQISRNDLPADPVTFICGLKACVGDANIIKAHQIHAHILKIGIVHTNVRFASILIGVYAKCGMITETKYIFRSILIRDVVLWNAYISGLSELGLDDEALKCFDQMMYEGLCPNSSTFISSLKACSYMGPPFKGYNIHVQILKQGLLEHDEFVGSMLIDAYVKSGLCVEAESVFRILPAQDTVSWNALLAGYNEHSSGEEALSQFKILLSKGIVPDTITFLHTLKACSSTNAITEGQVLHMEIVKRGFQDVELENILIDMYAKCSSLDDAQYVFDSLTFLNSVSSNTLISGYIECGCEEKVISLYKHQCQEHVDATTLICLLKACSALKAVKEAEEIHNEAVCKGFEHNPMIGNSLVDIYARCGCFREAHYIFQKLGNPDVFAWTALLAGYVEHGLSGDAIHQFDTMLSQGVLWDAVALVCILGACGNTHAIEKGRALHTEALKRGLLDSELSVGNAIIDMYAKCGALGDAQKLFSSLSLRDTTSWNAFMSGYVEVGCSEDAVGFFEQMQLDGISSDISLLICSLKVCSSLAAIDIGRELHAEIVEKGLETQLLIGNTLIDFYVKCGTLPAAQYAFNSLEVHDLVSWNTIVNGCGQHGQSMHVSSNLDRMRGEGVVPDSVTFSSVLSACSHAGLVDLGQEYFEAIVRDHFVVPTLEHFTCLVDILGRAGQVDRALEVTSKMPCHPGTVPWHSVLGACTRGGSVKIGEHAFEHVMALDADDAAAYVCMCNVYVNAIMHEQCMLVHNKF
ncbi:hypothetical protein KP509_31G059600 [Ceratopteris richardii]|nr:hypothetical protein KP509_31G059600 [Ceratopteris richardii]KAH7289134.1 hypothetical protein KP509_31G059600 [Ceratopteris richardii]